MRIKIDCSLKLQKNFHRKLDNFFHLNHSIFWIVFFSFLMILKFKRLFLKNILMPFTYYDLKEKKNFHSNIWIFKIYIKFSFFISLTFSTATLTLIITNRCIQINMIWICFFSFFLLLFFLLCSLCQQKTSSFRIQIAINFSLIPVI